MGTRDEYVSSIKAAFVSLQTRIVLGLIISWLPVSWNPIAFKIVNMFLEPILKLLFTKAVDQTELAAFFIYVDTRTHQQSKDFETAAFNNWKVQQNGTKEEKQKAEAELWKSFKAFAVITN